MPKWNIYVKESEKGSFKCKHAVKHFATRIHYSAVVDLKVVFQTERTMKSTKIETKKGTKRMLRSKICRGAL